MQALASRSFRPYQSSDVRGVEIGGASKNVLAIACGIVTGRGLGARAPVLAVAMTVGMLALAGIPGTVGFIGKFQLIHALVDGDYTWLAIVLVVGSMISLGYYLRVVAAMWMGSYRPAPAQVATVAEGGLPPIAGGSQQADEGEEGAAGSPGTDGGGADEISPAAQQRGPAWLPAYPALVFVAVLFAAATIFFGIVPQPLFHFADHAGRALLRLP